MKKKGKFDKRILIIFDGNITFVEYKEIST